MLKKSKQSLIMAASLFLLFIIFTVMVQTIDVRPIGPEQSSVGFASVNKFVFELFGVNPLWYNVSEWMGAAAMAEGLVARMKRELGREDATVIATGGLAGIVADSTDAFDVVDGQLTIKGICEIYRRMQELG